MQAKKGDARREHACLSSRAWCRVGPVRLRVLSRSGREKFLEKMPAVTQESFAAGQKWGQAIATDMRTGIIEELRKRGHNI